MVHRHHPRNVFPASCSFHNTIFVTGEEKTGTVAHVGPQVTRIKGDDRSRYDVPNKNVIGAVAPPATPEPVGRMVFDFSNRTTQSLKDEAATIAMNWRQISARAGLIG